MKYEQFRQKNSFTNEELLAFSHAALLEDAPPEFAARLPTPPMLMVDRILEIERNGPRGRIVAERDVRLDDWFFQCHFLGDPVQPGCLGVDGVWQLLGFFCAWAGGLGAGRALGCGEVEFAGQIRPRDVCVRYEITVRRYTEMEKSGASMVIGDATVLVDESAIYTIQRARVGTFQGICYPDYPAPSENSTGGRSDR
ncbi:MAG: bifunctional 3-hydroxydecanoyl-ACP dehydratase/trans-2-decenoyl-ACP isomerase [Myxococcota bacterium]